MGKCSTTILTVSFDFSEPQLTRVVVTQDYAGDCPLMDRRFEKVFPARIPAVDLFAIDGGIKDYLLWPH